jgi:hypothetical protein
MLSRAPEHAGRRELLHRFYRELDIDAHKPTNETLNHAMLISLGFRR